MPKAASAKRYAQAVFDLAKEKGQLAGWLTELRSIQELLREPQIKGLMESARIPAHVKRRVLDDALAGSDPLARNFINLLLQKDRLAILDDIVEDFQALADAQNGIQHVEAITAVPLDEAGQKKMEDRLDGLTGMKIVLSTRVDESLIGGIVTRLGDKVIDGSTRTKLLALKRSIAEAAH